MSVEYDDSGMKKFKRNLSKFSKPRNISDKDLFPDSFMLANTKFGTFQDFINACGIKEFEEKGEKFKQFIITNTRFPSWNKMLEVATAGYFKKELGI